MNCWPADCWHQLISIDFNWGLSVKDSHLRLCSSLFSVLTSVKFGSRFCEVPFSVQFSLLFSLLLSSVVCSRLSSYDICCPLTWHGCLTCLFLSAFLWRLDLAWSEKLQDKRHGTATQHILIHHLRNDLFNYGSDANVRQLRDPSLPKFQTRSWHGIASHQLSLCQPFFRENLVQPGHHPVTLRFTLIGHSTEVVVAKRSRIRSRMMNLSPLMWRVRFFPPRSWILNHPNSNCVQILRKQRDGHVTRSGAVSSGARDPRQVNVIKPCVEHMFLMWWLCIYLILSILHDVYINCN